MAGTESATRQRVTKRKALELHAPEVIACIVEGMSDQEIATKYGKSRGAVWAFYQRHSEEIDAAKAQFAKAVTDYAIANKAYRIGEMDALYSKMRAEVDEYGLAVVEVEYHMDNEGKETGRTETRDFRAPLIREMRGVLKDAADELGQLPKPSITVDQRKTYVLQVVGTDGRIPLG